MKWYDKLKYRDFISKALDPEVECPPNWREEVKGIHAIMQPLFEFFLASIPPEERPEDKHVFYGLLTRWGSDTGLLTDEEYSKVRYWLTNFELG
jgi:type II restriction/modification system DNA methylase subunit YeeA